MRLLPSGAPCAPHGPPAGWSIRGQPGSRELSLAHASVCPWRARRASAQLGYNQGDFPDSKLRSLHAGMLLHRLSASMSCTGQLCMRSQKQLRLGRLGPASHTMRLRSCRAPRHSCRAGRPRRHTAGMSGAPAKPRSKRFQRCLRLHHLGPTHRAARCYRWTPPALSRTKKLGAGSREALVSSTGLKPRRAAACWCAPRPAGRWP